MSAPKKELFCRLHLEAFRTACTRDTDPHPCTLRRKISEDGVEGPCQLRRDRVSPDVEAEGFLEKPDEVGGHTSGRLRQG